MITADASCRLLDIDFAGIEAVLIGRCLIPHHAEDAKTFMRLARLGLIAAVTAIAQGNPVDLAQPDDVLGPRLAAIKQDPANTVINYKSKRTVHGPD